MHTEFSFEDITNATVNLKSFYERTHNILTLNKHNLKLNLYVYIYIYETRNTI